MDIKLTNTNDNEPPLLIPAVGSKPGKSNRKCDICSKSNSQYTCPRCNNSYCNLKCYQSPEHTSCSEEFYKEQVLDELKNCRLDEESRSKV